LDSAIDIGTSAVACHITNHDTTSCWQYQYHGGQATISKASSSDRKHHTSNNNTTNTTTTQSHFATTNSDHFASNASDWSTPRPASGNHITTVIRCNITNIDPITGHIANHLTGHIASNPPNTTNTNVTTRTTTNTQRPCSANDSTYHYHYYDCNKLDRTTPDAIDTTYNDNSYSYSYSYSTATCIGSTVTCNTITSHHDPNSTAQ
jgi:hypothetical protein